MTLQGRSFAGLALSAFGWLHACGPSGAIDSAMHDAGMDAYNPCPIRGDACKVLPLGDSITYGIPMGGGYRIELFRQAVVADQNITFVGSQMNGPDMVEGTVFPKNHEGYPGYTIEQIDPRIVSNALHTKPDIVTLMIGTNDMYGSDPANAPQRFTGLIDEILDMDSHALLVVARLTPLKSYQRNVDAYNKALAGIVQEHAATGKHVALVDMADTMIGSDGIHPNDAGYAHMGQVWYAAIGKLLPPKN